MKSTPRLKLRVENLCLPLRTTFKQASSVRNHGESIWCHAEMDGQKGYGEGCPRIYVTGENLETSLTYLSEIIPAVEANCHDLFTLKKWMSECRREIDEHPAAWCAVETALLDLFARLDNCSVEKSLGLDEANSQVYQYTAVLGDSGKDAFSALTTRYLSTGFTDFKIKVSGELEHDRNRLFILRELAVKHGLENPRIRLDANNLWSNNNAQAIDFLSQLKSSFFGIEEPVSPKDYTGLGQVSEALDLPVVLDESLCALSDFELLDEMKGEYVANLKVSRLGGVLRSLEMVDALKKRGKKIIIGAHVGETSVLTRAGMCVAQAAGENLIAHEGGFGEILLEKDKVIPSLFFGKKGQINLNKFDGDWGAGWGLEIKDKK